MFTRLSRSWQLLKASAEVLRQDKQLLVFPAVSAIATLLVAASFMLPLFPGFDPAAIEAAIETRPDWYYAWLFAFYLVQYFVIFFFNAALVGAAMIRLDGGDPTVGDGFGIAFSRIRVILGYAAIAATVGLVLRAIEERVGFIGRIATGFVGVAWTLASALTVPILVTRDVGPIEAVKESAVLLKKTWGENLVGAGGLGIAFGLIYSLLISVLVVATIAALSSQSVELLATVVTLGVASVLVLALIHAALGGIYSAALYRYASGGQAGAFQPELLGAAYRQR